MAAMYGGGSGKVARIEKKADKAMDKAVKASKNMVGSKDRAKADKAASRVGVLKDKLSTVKGKIVEKVEKKYDKNLDKARARIASGKSSIIEKDRLNKMSGSFTQASKKK